MEDYVVDKQVGANLVKLAEDVLKELPDQICDYMLSKKIKPNIIAHSDMSSLGN